MQEILADELGLKVLVVELMEILVLKQEVILLFAELPSMSTVVVVGMKLN